MLSKEATERMGEGGKQVVLPSAPSGLTTLTEAHRRIGVTVETIRRWADRGDIRVVRIGGRRLLFAEDVKRLAETRK